MVFNTLSGRFLGLTILFVVIAEVLIFVPSIARFRLDYLQNRLDLAQLAALALLATPDEMVAPDLEAELLDTAEVLNVVLRRDDVRELVLASQLPAPVVETFDIRDAGVDDADARRPARLCRPRRPHHPGDRAPSQSARSEIEVTLHEWPLRKAMIAYGLRILYLSLAISVATGALLFFAVQRFIVRPISRVVDHMTAYQDDPEDASRIIEPQGGARELVQAETALHDLQVRLTGALRQKERLAALGGAVAKISHDLRNLLTTAQILADRIDASTDPGVKRTAPKLLSSLSRAISLCERTLTFGRAEEPPPEPAVFPLAPLVEEVLAGERLATPEACAGFVAEIPAELKVRADADQLFRVLSNLVRNAAQAIEAAGHNGRVTIAAREAAGQTEIRVADTGPGLPQKARDNLFQPFRGGVRQGGSGLGLVIAAELCAGTAARWRWSRPGRGGRSFASCCRRRGREPGAITRSGSRGSR